MRKALLLTILLLAACGSATPLPLPQVVVITATAQPVVVVGDVLPVEAQRIIDAATATAAAVATAQAQATATDEAARATSTTAARLTADALMVRQTETVLQLTAGAGQALATDSAARRTQAADQTAAAATPAAAAQLAAVGATATALARQERAAERRQASDEQIRTGALIGILAVVLIALLGFAAAFVFGMSDLFSARAAMDQAAAERARAEAMQLWIFQYGGNVFRLNGGQWEIMPTQPQIAAPALSEPEPSTMREVPVRAHGEVISSIPVGQPETPERARVLHLLLTAQGFAGPSSVWIPSADKLGMHRQEWMTAVNSLKATPEHPAYVMTSPGKPKAGQGGRTRLCQASYRTLGALIEGIKRGDVLPRPAAPALEPPAGNVPNTQLDNS